MKGCYTTVCSVQSSAQTMTRHTMTGIQALNNFSFEHGGMQAWRAYNVGHSKSFTTSQIQRFGTAQGLTNLIVEKTFSKPHVETGVFSSSMPASQRHLNNQRGPSQLPSTQSDPSQDEEDVVHFACPVEGCIKVYQSFSNLQRQLDVGQHLLKLERKSPYDEIK